MKFAVIIPALNEARFIETTLSAARGALPDAQLIVVDGGSTDGTAQIAAAHGAQVLHATPGRGNQMHAGAAASSREVIIFLHADTLLPADAAPALERALTDPNVVGGAFSFGFGTERVPFILRQLARGITLRSALFKTATGDQAIFARREVLERIGGVQNIPLFEDVRLFRQLRRAGRVVILPTAIATSPRLWQQVGPLRLIAIHLLFRLLHALGVSPNTLARWYPANASASGS